MKILLAVDESIASEDAVLEVGSRFWGPGTTVRLLHAIERFVPPAVDFWYDAGGSLEKANRRALAHHRRIVNEFASFLRERQLKVEAIIRMGSARKCIVTEAKEWGADLIVLGSHEHSFLRRALLGSVCRFVCEHAPCSVQVVH